MGEYYNIKFPYHPNSEQSLRVAGLEVPSGIVIPLVSVLAVIKDKMKEELKEKDWENTPEEHIIAYEDGHAAAMAHVESEIEKLRSQIWELERQIRESD